MLGPIFDFSSASDYEEGWKEGVKKGKIRVALNMLAYGTPIDIIFKYTELSIYEINKLKDRINKVIQVVLDDYIEGFDIFKANSESNEQGREIGIAENRISTARNLLASGVSDDIIINCTGISPADFEKIKAETEKN